MRPKLLDILSCPSCRGRLSIKNVQQKDENEIIEGELSCSDCRTVFRIKSGAVDMVIDANPVVAREVDGNAIKSTERASVYDDEWLLSLPGGFERDAGHRGPYLDHYNFFGMIKSAGIRKEDAVLDLGCGTTWTSNEMAKLSDNVIASDISMEKYIGLESARVFIKRYGNHYERVRMDMCRIPLRDRTADFTVNEASLHHAHDLDSALGEISRVLKSGGKALFINEPMANVLDFRKPSERHGRLEREVYGWNENKYTFPEHTKALRKAGLKLRKVFYPESVRHKLLALAGGGGNEKNLKYLAGKLLAGPYAKSPAVRNFTEKVLFYPMLALGIPFCAMATKED